MPFAAASSFITKRSCISGSPPLMVNPPFIVFSAKRYFFSSSVARATVTGSPLVIVQVSGLWQYWHRHMHPLVQATTRMPGPSTAEPVVNEWRKPMSPFASAWRTSSWGTCRPRPTRNSYGLCASSAAGGTAWPSGIAASVERPVDDVHLLRAGEADEIDRVPGHADREAWILLRMIHRVEQRVAIEHVDVHVEPGGPEVRIEDRREVLDAIPLDAAEAFGHQRRGQRDAVR